MWKLDRLMAKAESRGNKVHYSESHGIATLSIHDKTDEIIIHKGKNLYWECEAEEDNIDDMITEAENDYQ